MPRSKGGYVRTKAKCIIFDSIYLDRIDQVKYLKASRLLEESYGNIKCGVEDNPRLFQLVYVVIHNQKIIRATMVYSGNVLATHGSA